MTAALRAMKKGKAGGGGVDRASIQRAAFTKPKRKPRKKRRLRGYSSVR